MANIVESSQIFDFDFLVFGRLSFDPCMYRFPFLLGFSRLPQAAQLPLSRNKIPICMYFISEEISTALFRIPDAIMDDVISKAQRQLKHIIGPGTRAFFTIRICYVLNHS